MAQLPPKIPNVAGNWPEFSHQKIPIMVRGGGFPPNAAAHHPLWVDDFLDISSSRRGSHRRSVSDSIAFLEMPMLDECPDSATNYDAGENNEFDRFDDEQFMSMFTYEISSAVGPTASSSNPSTPSDHNSIDDEKDVFHNTDQKQQKNESDEVQSHCKPENQAPYTAAAANAAADRITDPKRVKRILANRQSAQRSRVRKLQYISELERNVTSLQAKVSVLSPRVVFLDHQRLLLNVDNSALKQRIAALAQDKIFKDAKFLDQENFPRKKISIGYVLIDLSRSVVEIPSIFRSESVLSELTNLTKSNITNVGQTSIGTLNQYLLPRERASLAHQEALEREIERLRQVYQQQNLKMIENIEHSPPSSDSKSATDKKENLLNV